MILFLKYIYFLLKYLNYLVIFPHYFIKIYVLLIFVYFDIYALKTMEYKQDDLMVVLFQNEDRYYYAIF